MTYLSHFAMELTGGFGGTLARRLLAASLELAVLTAAAACLGVLFGPRRVRLSALLWALVLVKPLLTLAGGSLLSLHIPTPALQTHTSSDHPRAPAELADDGPLTAAFSRGEEPTLTIPGSTNGAAPETSLASLLLFLWAVGAALLLGRLGHDLAGVRRVLRSSSDPPKPLRLIAGDTARECGLKRSLCLRVSGEVDCPAIVGFFRPVILIPRWLLDPEALDALRWSIRHEIVHARHLDPLVNFIRRIAETFFFFHPAAWIAGRRWETAAELACDQSLVRDPAEARDYATQLYSLLMRTRLNGWDKAASALGATRTQIGRRIETLLRTEPGSFGRTSGAARWLLLVGGAAVAVCGVTIIPAEAQVSDGKASFHTRNLNIEESRGGGDSRALLNAKGYFEFQGDAVWEILKVKRRAMMKLIETIGDVTREVRVSSGGSSRPVYQYSENGKSQEFNDDARNWMGRWLAKILGEEEPPAASSEQISIAHEASGEPEGSPKPKGSTRRIRINAQTEETDGVRVDRLEAHGVFEFSADGRDILSMDSGSRFSIERAAGDKKESVTLSPGTDGRPVAKYLVNGGERSMDADARRWLESVVLRLAHGGRANRR